MKIVTRESSQVVRAFQKHVGIQAFFKISIFMGIICLLGILLIIIDMIGMGIYAIAFSVLFLIIFPFVLKYVNEKLNKSNNLMMSEKIVELEFLEEKFSMKCYQDQEMINSMTCKYESIFKVDENNEYFFIYIANNQALCVAKYDIDEKETSELRGLLQGNCPKYKITKY